MHEVFWLTISEHFRSVCRIHSNLTDTRGRMHKNNSSGSEWAAGIQMNGIISWDNLSSAVSAGTGGGRTLAFKSFVKILVTVFFQTLNTHLFEFGIMSFQWIDWAFPEPTRHFCGCFNWISEFLTSWKIMKNVDDSSCTQGRGQTGPPWQCCLKEQGHRPVTVPSWLMEFTALQILLALLLKQALTAAKCNVSCR